MKSELKGLSVAAPTKKSRKMLQYLVNKLHRYERRSILYVELPEEGAAHIVVKRPLMDDTEQQIRSAFREGIDRTVVFREVES